MVLAPFGQPEFRSAHGNDVIEAISSMNIEIPGDGAESMSGIEIAVAIEVGGAAPKSFVARLEEDFPEVVVVRRPAVLELTEEPRLHHLEHEKLVVAVAAVLHHQAVASGFLRRVDERPALLDRERCRHLRRSVNPM